MTRSRILGLVAVLALLAPAASAQVKISNLPDAHLPLTGFEVVPIVQENTTRKAAITALVAAASHALQPQNNLSDVESATTSRTNLGVAIGSNVEAWDADLDALAGLGGTNTIYYRSGLNAWSPVTIGGNLTFSGGTLNGAAAGVTVTGTPATGNLTKFSGASSLTNGDLSGDCTTSGTLAITCTKTGGVAFAASATTNTTSASNISSGTLAAARGGAGTITGILKANGAGAVSAAVSSTDYAPATSGSALLKGNGTGGFSNAASGTDYAPATSGAAILYGNGSGGFSNVTIGSGLTFTTGTLTATGGGGTPGGTSGQVQFNSAGSFGGFTVSGDGTLNTGTGALTVTKTNGVSFGTAATVNTGTSGATLPLLNAGNTWSATQTHGSASTLALVTSNIGEPVTVAATAATGTINYDALTQSVVYFTTNASANWTLNLRGSASVSMNTLLAVGQSITLTHLVTQGATAFFNNVVQVDGATAGVTTKWQGGAPTLGNPSGVDVYTYTVIKTGSAAFTVLASQTPFS